MKSKLKNPIFIASVCILLVNDFYLKYAFPCFLTGKLSDFVGLFAFPFFFSSLLPQYKKHIHIATAMLFVFWKSHYSQPLIDAINTIGIPFDRIVDPSDNIALISVLLSYFLFSMSNYKVIKPILKYTIMGVSVFSFIATTQPRRCENIPTYKFVNIEKSYEFPFSREELIKKYNSLQIDRVDYHKKYYAGDITTDSTGNIYTWNYKGVTGTIAQILDYDKLKNTDTIWIDDENARFYITGNNLSSKINLENLTESSCLIYADTITINKTTDSIPEQYNYAIQYFENRIVEKLNNKKDTISE